jgi:hypothetical protein
VTFLVVFASVERSVVRGHEIVTLIRGRAVGVKTGDADVYPIIFPVVTRTIEADPPLLLLPVCREIIMGPVILHLQGPLVTVIAISERRAANLHDVGTYTGWLPGGNTAHYLCWRRGRTRTQFCITGPFSANRPRGAQIDSPTRSIGGRSTRDDSPQASGRSSAEMPVAGALSKPVREQNR